MFRMDKEALKLHLKYFDNEIRLEGDRIDNCEEYKLFSDKITNLYKEQSEKSRELKKIEKSITLKYVKELDGGYSFSCHFKPNQIKSSVKRGIKKGLSIKSISCVNQFDIKNIVNELIKIDLDAVKNQTDKIRKDNSEISKEIKENIENRENLRKHIDILCDKKKAIYNKLHKKEFDLEKKREKISKDFRNKVKNHLPKYIDKIKKEVERELILDNLK